MRKATAEWLKAAAMDLNSVAQIVHLEHLSPVAAFHAHQCVEKCLKAVLEEHSRRVPKDRPKLRLYGLTKKRVSLDMDLGTLTDLDDLYTDSRYPGEQALLPGGKPTVEDVEEFYRIAKYLYEGIKELYGSTTAQ